MCRIFRRMHQQKRTTSKDPTPTGPAQSHKFWHQTEEPRIFQTRNSPNLRIRISLHFE